MDNFWGAACPKVQGEIWQGGADRIFLILINDLTAGCLLHKFMDDRTVTEINHKDCVSSMDVILGQIIK